MKFLLTGLGNIGYEYENTRHNIGFNVVDLLCSQLDGSWRDDHHGELAEVKYKGRTLLLLKPGTYMNLSGKAVRYWLEKEKIPQERLIVITDDLALPLGKIRIRAKGSDGGHNGLKNIQELLNSSEYSRLRFGIGDQFQKGQQVDFVLGKWQESEAEEVKMLIEKSCQAILAFSTIGIDRTMSEFNK